MDKNLGNEYRQKLLDTTTDALETTSKKAIKNSRRNQQFVKKQDLRKDFKSCSHSTSRDD